MIAGFDYHQVLKMSYVKRWAIIDMSRDQSLAEHSYNVAILARRIVLDMPKDPFHGLMGGLNPSEFMNVVLAWALCHDLPEVYTGDIPSAFKRGIATEVASLEKELFPFYGKERDGTPPLALAVVKIADTFEAIEFANRYCIDRDKDDIMKFMLSSLKEYVNTQVPEKLRAYFIEFLAQDA